MQLQQVKIITNDWINCCRLASTCTSMFDWFIIACSFQSIEEIASSRSDAAQVETDAFVLWSYHYTLNDICSTAVCWRKRSWLAHASKSRCILWLLGSNCNAIFSSRFLLCCGLSDNSNNDAQMLQNVQLEISQVAMLSEQVQCWLLFTTTSILSIIMTVLFSPQVVLLAEKIQQIDTERKSRRAAAKP